MIGCGRPAAGPAPPDIDGDPLALLPGGVRVLAHVDAKALSADPATSAGATAIARALLPLGDDTGVDPGRDVESFVVAAYGSGASLDVVLVATGRFDPDRIAGSTQGAGGVAVRVTRYAGFPMSTLAATSYSPLSRRTLLAGTNDGVHRVLERVQAGHLERAVVPWMVDTVAAAGTAAVAADFTSDPLAAPSVPAIDLSWLGGVRVARLFAGLQPPGLRVDATLAYATGAQAEAAAASARSLGRWIGLLGPVIAGMKLQQLQASAEGSDLRCSFAVDDATLRAVLALVARAVERR